MVHIYILILTAVFCIAEAEDTPDKLRKEIEKIHNETYSTKEEIAVWKKKLDELHKQFKAEMNKIDVFNANRTKEEKYLIEEMWKLDIIATELDHRIKVIETKIIKLKDYNYRLVFIIKLLKQDLHMFENRRKVGDELNCYKFERNMTKIHKPVILQARSLGSFTPYQRQVKILKNEVLLAKSYLARAQTDLKLEIEAYNAQLKLNKDAIAARKDIMVSLIKAVKFAKETLAELRADIQKKKQEEKELEKKLEEIKGHHIKQLLDEIKILRQKLLEFSKAAACYKVIEYEEL